MEQQQEEKKQEKKSNLTRETYKSIKALNKEQLGTYLRGIIQTAFEDGWEQGQNKLGEEFETMVKERHDWWGDFIHHLRNYPEVFSAEAIDFLLNEANKFVNGGTTNMNELTYEGNPFRFRLENGKVYVAVVDVARELYLDMQGGMKFSKGCKDVIKEPYGSKKLMMVNVEELRPIDVNAEWMPVLDDDSKAKQAEFIDWFNDPNNLVQVIIEPTDKEEKETEEMEETTEDVKKEVRMRLTLEESEVIKKMRVNKKLEKEIEKLKEEINSLKSNNCEQNSAIMKLKEEVEQENTKLKEENVKLKEEVEQAKNQLDVLDEAHEIIKDYEKKFEAMKILLEGSN